MSLIIHLEGGNSSQSMSPTFLSIKTVRVFSFVTNSHLMGGHQKFNLVQVRGQLHLAQFFTSAVDELVKVDRQWETHTRESSRPESLSRQGWQYKTKGKQLSATENLSYFDFRIQRCYCIIYPLMCIFSSRWFCLIIVIIEIFLLSIWGHILDVTEVLHLLSTWCKSPPFT